MATIEEIKEGMPVIYCGDKYYISDKPIFQDGEWIVSIFNLERGYRYEAVKDLTPIKDK